MSQRFFIAFSLSAAFALLAGCDSVRSAQDQMPPIGAMSASSWMLPEAKGEDLVYISDQNTFNVYVYSYATGHRVGTLTGFKDPIGECADKAGNVWITNALANQILEYAHGGTTPIATLDDVYGFPVACSVDPTTGNLGVANDGHTVTIYQNAGGTPSVFSDSSFTVFFFCTYDAKGNFFVDGQSGSVSNDMIAELPRGGSAMKNVPLDKTIVPGSITWDGQYLAITMGSGPKGDTMIGRFRLTRKQARLASTVALQNQQGAATDSQFWLQGDVIIGPTVKYGEESGAGKLAYVWAYPQGGKKLEVLRRGETGAQLWGTTFSAAPR